MAAIKIKDFVEIDYTGRIKEDNVIFDTTQEKVAKENGLDDKKAKYAPMVICIGENHLAKGLEEQLIGKETEKEYTIEVSSDKAYGKKNAKLLQLIPLNKFRQQNIQPVPGLQLNIDGVFGVVKTVSGGRCYVDFNHPLAGKDLVYDVKINKIIDDDAEKLKALLKVHLHVKDPKIEIKEGSAHISLKEGIPSQAQDEFKKIVENVIPAIKNVVFTILKEIK
ncbi:peptidylprolyl isomerase [Candidatus Woesearchaeota archaeon]|jgi:FKBP-type peptidyl-prolyl cis-trans isomerase 2|nr:peptidylprolyl isomerase [Candidatus Woesearchaeota archaeon]|tara:strand:+ start:13153 stop:13818 length:666 start_codon:yes stop_codon:yes gene_type:complete